MAMTNRNVLTALVRGGAELPRTGIPREDLVKAPNGTGASRRPLAVQPSRQGPSSSMHESALTVYAHTRGVNDIRASCPFEMDNTAHGFAADDRPVILPPSGAAIDRMLACFEWVSALDEEQRHLLWKRASHEPWKDICAWMGCDRTTAWRRWNGALEAVLAAKSSSRSTEQGAPRCFSASRRRSSSPESRARMCDPLRMR